MTPYYSDDSVTLWHGDSLEVLRQMPDASVDCCVTSPPYYGLRDYGVEGQYGLEASPAEYVETMRLLFAEVRRVLADDGTLWLNIGDSYSVRANSSAGQTRARTRVDALPPRRNTTSFVPCKSLMLMPERLMLALVDDGWVLRNKIVWHKPNAMPESVTDRLSNRYENLFLLTKGQRYYFDLDAIREPQDSLGRRHEGRSGYRDEHPSKGGIKHRELHPLGRNPGDVWSMPFQPFTAGHFAVFPKALPSRCITAGCRPGGRVLDVFHGSGTTGAAATQIGRSYVGIDLNREYLDLSLRTRLAQSALVDGEAS